MHLKKRYSKKKNLLLIFPIMIIFLVTTLTIGFSAFQDNTLIKDIWAVVRVKKDIRVTGITLNSTTNNATSYWKNIM